jgi:hypothetical protein
VFPEAVEAIRPQESCCLQAWLPIPLADAMASGSMLLQVDPKGPTPEGLVQCNPHDILHRNRKINSEIHIEAQKTSNNQSNSEQNI